MKKTALAVAVGLLGVSALPAAAAKPTTHPSGPSSHPSGPNSTHCIYKAAYRVHGAYGALSDLTKDLTTGAYSGTTIELIETGANHHAKTAQSPFTAFNSADMTFAIGGAHVTVADDVDTAGGPTIGPPADRVMVKGTITEQHKSCTGEFTQTVTINRVVVTPPELTS